MNDCTSQKKAPLDISNVIYSNMPVLEDIEISAFPSRAGVRWEIQISKQNLNLKQK